MAHQNKSEIPTTLSKQVLPKRLFTELAILCAVAIHVFLVAGFRISTAPKQTEVQKTEPQCFLLAPHQYASSRWEQKLWWWTRMKDPTLLSQPDEQYGFSDVRTDPLSWPYTAPPSYRFTAALTGEPEPFPIQLLGKYPGVSDKISTSFPRVEVEVPHIDITMSLPEKVIWRTVDSSLIKSPPAMKMSRQKLNDLLQSTSVTAPTTIEVMRHQGLARARIRESCGNQQLDLLALDALQEGLEDLPENAPETVHADAIPPYVPEQGDTRVIDIEWRLMQRVSDKGNK